MLIDMETKKSFKADLRNKRSLFLEIGLVVALCLVVFAFSHTPEVPRGKAVVTSSIPVPEEYLPVNTEHLKPQRHIRVSPVVPILQIIANDDTAPTDFVWDDITADAKIELVAPTATEDIIDDNTIFLDAEKMPAFRGGDLNAFRTWVQENIKYPQVALDNGIFGRVTLAFVIEKDGRLTNIEVLQAPDRSLSEEAIRVLNASPKWAPGRQRNQAVRIKFTLPVEFRVQH